MNEKQEEIKPCRDVLSKDIQEGVKEILLIWSKKENEVYS